MRPCIEVVQLEVTKCCNYSCNFCKINQEQRMLDIKQLNHVLDFVKLLNIKYVTLTGGEPTINPLLIDFIELLQRNNIKVTIITNGSFLDFSLLNILRNNKASLAISIHSHIPHLHDTIVGQNGAWSNVELNLQKLRANKCHVILNNTLTKENYKYTYDYLKFFSEYENIIHFNFNKYISPCEKDREMLLDSAALNVILSQLQLAKTHFPNSLSIDSIPFCAVESKYHGLISKCIAGENYLYINVTGDVKYCHFSNNVIQNIFTKNKFTKNSIVKKACEEKKYYSANCYSCNSLSKCGGGCQYFKLDNTYL